MRLRCCTIALILLCFVGHVAADDIPSGELRIVGPAGEPAGSCPLQGTHVTAEIAGFVARTTVRQQFVNDLEEKIEAIYVFPLPHDAAVDRMALTVGDRRVVGEVKEREEARQIYEAARKAGQVAGLLDQERPNIFTQSVVNIEPGMRVEIEISYVETLVYDEGYFEWVFPMVVGPRYIPGGGSAPAPMTTGKPTSQVPDGDRITPPVVPEGKRSGHDVDLVVQLDPGMEILDLESVLHEVDVELFGRTGARVALKNEKTIPNRDFVLRYRVATDEIGHAFLTHADERGEFFTLILQPPQTVAAEDATPRELIFVLDTSGSMSGAPIEAAKQVIARMIAGMRGDDTFNLITFAGSTHVLWEEPQPGTAERRAQAQAFLESRSGRGGTEMMRAIETALVQTRSQDHERMRIVCFLTDGYVGNDMAIVDAVRANADTTRVFSFGIGNSVNRYLLDGMALAGRGEVEYVTLATAADDAVERFEKRLRSPVLTDIEIDWGSLLVAEVFPRRVPDLFSAKPILVQGRLTGPSSGTITVRGKTVAGDFEEPIAIRPAAGAGRDALASLWARAKVSDLMNRDLAKLQHGDFPQALKQEIVQLGVDFQLTTQFTSFVAVEEMIVTVGGEPRTVRVPVEMPDGVSHEGVFGGVPMAAASQLQSLGFVGAAPASLNSQHNRAAARPAPPPARIVVPVESAEEIPPRPENKLAAALRGLAERVAERGRDGNLLERGLTVRNYGVAVLVRLTEVSSETLHKLEQLGFVRAAESKATRMLVGTIDVRKLEELAALPQVIAIDPVPQPE